ncbi:MAG: collagen-like protein, partial [Wolbachia sp.]
PRGFNGTQGITGSPGQRGDQGLKGDIGPVGPKGPKEEDGISAAVADRFFSEVNQTKNELQNTQKEIEKSRNASESFAKEAQKARDKTTGLHDKVVNLTQKAETSSKDTKKFATQALSLQRGTQTFYRNTKDMFCGIKPTDSVCTARRRKRETRNANNQPVTSGAGRPTSFISQIINFFYPSIKQDKYKIENNMHELNQVVRIVDAANIILKFEKVLGEAASRCGIPKKCLNLDLTELQSAIVSRSLLDDKNRNEMLKFLCEAAKKSCSNYKQADKFLALFKDNMKRTLVNNEQQRGCVSTEETATDNSQPRSFMSNIIPPTSLSSISQMAVGYLR